MSNTKRLAVILMIEVLMLIFGLMKVSITAAYFAIEIPNYTMQYMLGYSIPIIAMGLIAFGCCVYILRDKVVHR